jgi:tetratricopeptide (TPR) repeat protein
LLARLAVPGAWLAAALWALHPVQVESVAWMTERKNVLMGVFFFLALRAWVEFTKDETVRRRGFYALALGCFAVALSAKTTACTLPVALLLIWALQKKPVNRARWLQVAPFAALAAGMALLTMWWERYQHGTHGKAFAIGFPDRILIACRSVWFYLFKLFWPGKLTFSYPRWEISAANPADYAWLVAVAAAAAWIYSARRTRAGRGLWIAAVFFAATLSPMLGFVMLFTFRYSFVADHYQYLACLGPMALAGAGAAWGGARLGSGEKNRGRSGWQPALCGILLAVLGILTWRQSGIYANAETLWRATIARNPSSWLALNNLGLELLRKKRPEEAFPHFRRALEIKPDNAFAAFSLANLLAQKGRLDEAIFFYRKTVEIQPDSGEAHKRLGTAFYQSNQPVRAIRAWRDAIRFAPGDLEAHNNLAWALATCSDAEARNGTEAVEVAQQAVRLAGDTPPVLRTLAAAFAEAGRFSEAVETARSALQRTGTHTALAEALRKELHAYQAGEPLRSAQP